MVSRNEVSQAVIRDSLTSMEILANIDHVVQVDSEPAGL